MDLSSWLHSSLLLLTAAFILLKFYFVNTEGVRGEARGSHQFSFGGKLRLKTFFFHVQISSLPILLDKAVEQPTRDIQGLWDT